MAVYYCAGLAYDSDYLAHYGRKGMEWGKNKFGSKKTVEYRRSNNLFDSTTTIKSYTGSLGGIYKDKHGGLSRKNAYDMPHVTTIYNVGKISQAKKDFPKTVAKVTRDVSSGMAKVQDFVTGNSAKRLKDDADMRSAKAGFGGESYTAAKKRWLSEDYRQEAALNDNRKNLYQNRRNLLDFNGKRIDKEAIAEIDKESSELRSKANDAYVDYILQRRKDYEDWEKAQRDKRLAESLYEKTIPGGAIKQSLSRTAKDVSNWGSEQLNAGKGFLDSAGKWTVQAGKDVSKWTGQAAKDVGNTAKKAGQAIGEGASKAGQAIGKGAKAAGDWTGQAAKDVGKWGGEQLNKGKKFFKNIFG